MNFKKLKIILWFRGIGNKKKAAHNKVQNAHEGYAPSRHLHKKLASTKK